MVYRAPVLGIGAASIVIGFILCLIAITTNYWVEIQVDRSSLAATESTLAAYTRNRGLFRECFRDGDVRSLVRANELADANNECILTEFSLSRDVSYSYNYRTRTNLQIAMVVFLCFTLLLCVCAFAVFCYSVSIAENFETRRWSLSTKWAGILMFIAAFCNALGMAFFHGAEYMETQVIGTESASSSPYLFYFLKNQPNAVETATIRTYSWSYALSWLAVFFEVLAAVCWFLVGTCCIPRRKEKQSMDFGTLNSTRSYGQRNMAYDYMETQQPVVMYGGPQPHMISDGVYHDHFQGRHYNPYVKGPVHVEARPQYNYDEGGWSWQ